MAEPQWLSRNGLTQRHGCHSVQLHVALPLAPGTQSGVEVPSTHVPAVFWNAWVPPRIEHPSTTSLKPSFGPQSTL